MIDQATHADAEVMASIHAVCFPASEAWSQTLFEQQLQQPNVFALLHRSGGMIVVRIAADEAESLTLAVIPLVRRGGIGAALLHQATTMAATLGVQTVFLEVSTRNSGAHSLYTKSGFRKTGERRHYYLDGSDALVLRHDLSAP
jgi:ribosomal-protein-alanine N-acetyltransferase